MNSEKFNSPSPSKSNSCIAPAMAAVGVAAKSRITSRCEILPLPSASQLRKAASNADSVLASPSLTAAANHSVYSSSCEPSVSSDSNTESTQRTRCAAPQPEFSNDADSSSLLIRPLWSLSQAKKCSRKPSILSVASCMARAVSIARWRIEPLWKLANEPIKFFTCSLGTTLWLYSSTHHRHRKACSAVSLLLASVRSSPANISLAGSETI
mmetsp:Transcript_105115/g.273623  ORF Transcript_105115/g.273623 Transcript_105115/m.273623 type:complete len:211 (-) Transcript_105115:130-762(-)